MKTSRLLLCVSAAIALLAPVLASAQNTRIVGNWHGVLKAKNVKLEVILHVSIAQDGSLAAVLDSVSQDSPNIPVDTISLNGSHLEYSVPSVGIFRGELSADGNKLNGAWTEGGSTDPLNFQRMVTAPKPFLDLNGTWEGSFLVKKNIAHVSLHIDTACCATIGIAIDWKSERDEVEAAPTHDVSIRDGVVSFKSNRLSAEFKGEVSADGKQITGLWKEHGETSPLTLTRTATAPSRVQN